MKTQQSIISEVRLVYSTKVKASDRLQVKCPKDAFDILMEKYSKEKSAFSHYLSVCAYFSVGCTGVEPVTPTLSR